jgi:hypothetical protein
MTDQRIHVGAVHIEKSAFGMEDVSNLMDLLLEDSESIRIGEHQRRNIFVHLRFKGGDVNNSSRIRFQILNRVTDHRCCGGIRAMS